MLECLKNLNWKALSWHDEENPSLKKIVEDFQDKRVGFYS